MPHIPPEQHPPVGGGVDDPPLDPVRAIPLNTCVNSLDPQLSHFRDDTISCFLSYEDRNSITSPQSAHLYSYKGIIVVVLLKLFFLTRYCSGQTAQPENRNILSKYRKVFEECLPCEFRTNLKNADLLVGSVIY